MPGRPLGLDDFVTANAKIMTRANGLNTVNKRLCFAISAITVLVLFLNVSTVGRQAEWEDEVFAVSTAWSIVHSKPPILSVLAQYPSTRSPLPFYGPVSISSEARLIRLFGLSPIVWRLACLSGVFLTISACWHLVKLGGGDIVGRLFTALIIALAGSVAATLPGRWDAVTVGLFLTGLRVFLQDFPSRGRLQAWRTVLAGLLIGLALGSSPRTLTLSAAAVVAMGLTGLCFAEFRRFFLLGTLWVFLTAAFVHTLLLLPLGETTISWYLYVRRATKTDYINATPLAGRGLWTLDLQHHKILALLLILLILIPLGSAFRRRSQPNPRVAPIQLCLTAFAAANLILMMLVVANPLGQGPFWLPPIVVAAMCAVDPSFRRERWVAVGVIPFAAVCLMLLGIEELEQVAAIMLTWNQRSSTALTSFFEGVLPPGAPVYGPVGGYFYPVELSGHPYLYVNEQTTPGLHSLDPTPAGDKLDAMICSHQAYAVWPNSDPVYHPPLQDMPDALRQRLQGPPLDFHQPPLAPWKTEVLKRMGPIDNKYGFADITLYALKSDHCGVSVDTAR